MVWMPQADCAMFCLRRVQLLFLILNVQVPPIAFPSAAISKLLEILKSYHKSQIYKIFCKIISHLTSAMINNSSGDVSCISFCIKVKSSFVLAGKILAVLSLKLLFVTCIYCTNIPVGGIWALESAPLITFTMSSIMISMIGLNTLPNHN